MANREISGTVPSGRMVWIDGFRGLAVVIMVWVHVAKVLVWVRLPHNPIM